MNAAVAWTYIPYAFAFLGLLLAFSAYADYRAKLRRTYLAGAQYGAQQALNHILHGLGGYADTLDGEVHSDVETAFQNIAKLGLRPPQRGDFVLDFHSTNLNRHIRERQSLLSSQDERSGFSELGQYFFHLKELGEALGYACKQRTEHQAESKRLDTKL